MSNVDKVQITIDISDETILWICEACNVRRVYLISQRSDAIQYMRDHRTYFHKASQRYNMVSTRGNQRDFQKVFKTDT